jgi:hypothetical protein
MADLSGMNTLSEIMDVLQEKQVPEFLFTDRGFTLDHQRHFGASELQIIKVYRFEGSSDPSDMSVLYVLETRDGGQKGYSLNAYGVYDDQGEAYSNFIREIPEKGHGEQLLFEL